MEFFSDRFFTREEVVYWSGKKVIAERVKSVPKGTRGKISVHSELANGSTRYGIKVVWEDPRIQFSSIFFMREECWDKLKELA